MNSNAVQPPVKHDTLVVKRQFDCPAALVFSAWSSQESKRAWFSDNKDWENFSYTLEFRVGGKEYDHSRLKSDGMDSIYDARIEDIVEDQRIVTSYSMTINGERISASLLTLEFVDQRAANQSSTQLILTEQIAMLDGQDQSASRSGGWEWIFDNLANELKKRQSN